MTTSYQSAYDIYAHYGRHLIDKHVTLYQESLNASLSPDEQIRLPRDGLHLPRSLVADDAQDSDLTVGILGAGVGGLYAALILDSLDIKYEIIEASNRVGGRLYTHKFKKPDGSPGDKYDYYDVGAMRFPNNLVMTRLFHLFNYPPLNTTPYGLSSKLRDYYFKDAKENSLLYFNDVRKTRKSSPGGDDFLWSQLDVSKECLEVGVTPIVKDVIEPFSNKLVRDLDQGTDDGS